MRLSATLLTLALALPVFGRVVGGRTEIRFAMVGSGAIVLSSVANLFEDGFRIEWAFFVVILGTLILLVALIALGVVIARSGSGRSRVLALIPVGTVTGILLFVAAGGPIMLVTWLAAAGVALQGPPTRIAVAKTADP